MELLAFLLALGVPTVVCFAALLWERRQTVRRWRRVQKMIDFADARDARIAAEKRKQRRKKAGR